LVFARTARADGPDLFDKAAIDGGYDVVVTGHNLDDEAAVRDAVAATLTAARRELPHLQRTLLMRRRVTERFHYDEVTVCHSLTQRFICGVQIDRDCLVCNMIDNLPDFVTVRTALV